MTRLHAPDVALCDSWSEAVREFGDETVHGAGLWHRSEEEREDLTRDGCARFVAQLRSYADPDRPLEDGMVHCDYCWIVAGAPEEVVGFIAVRHELTPALLQDGGHIGYAVRPARRRQGHATRALALAVRRAAELGILRALVTCDDDNLASAATIENNGGVLEDVRQGKRRYWITTSSDPSRPGAGYSGR